MSARTSTPTRPLLRYHGGKWRIAPWIIEHMPKHRVYVEPFGGGGSVLIRKGRCYAEVYNDLDGEITNLFRVLRDEHEKLSLQLQITPYGRNEFDLSYEPTDDPVERARRTIVRSCMGFGGNLGRPTKSGKPQRTGFRMTSEASGTNCAKTWMMFPALLPPIAERMRGVVIENRDASECMLQHDSENVLHYVDPPYVLSTRDTGGDYRHELTDDDHRKLAEVLHSLKGMVLLSGYHSPLYDELFGDWPRVERAAHADGARDRVEVLWMRNIPTDRLL